MSDFGSGLKSGANTPIGGICRSHQEIFFRVAQANKVWILVRATNKSSLKYIGPKYPNVIPKPQSCKAKTADCGPLAGLVACPELVPAAYSSDRLEEAESTWKEWAPEWLPVRLEKAFLTHYSEMRQRPELVEDGYETAGMPIHYAVINDPDSPWYGCVVNLRDGSPKMMHGDYDLYDVIDPNSPNRRMRHEQQFNGSISYYGPLTVKVRDDLNRLMSDGQVSTAMIQHGEQLAYGGHKEDMIFAFSPNPGDALIVIYPFAFGLKSVHSLYEKIFNNRRPF